MVDSDTWAPLLVAVVDHLSCLNPKGFKARARNLEATKKFEKFRRLIENPPDSNPRPSKHRA